MRRLMMITVSFFLGAGIAWAAPTWIMEDEVAKIDATAMHDNCSGGVAKVKIDFKTGEVTVYCYGDYTLPPTKADKLEILTRHTMVPK